MSAKHRLRRSCAFCRARKIKCSNEAICEACRKQSADCIYDFEPARSKARQSSMDVASTDAPPTPTRPKMATSGASSASSQSVTQIADAPFANVTEDGDSVAAALERMFYNNFAPQQGVLQPGAQPSSTILNSQIESMSRSMSSQSQYQLHQSQSQRQATGGINPMYTGILSLLTQDLVGLVTDQFGALGCHHVETGQARFFLSALANDDTQTMFGSEETSPSDSEPNPVSELSQRTQTQLIDAWYSNHPLSFLVSKTLLLRELRDGTHDDILLAVILGEASLYNGNEPRGQRLMRWAASQMRTRPVRGNHLRQNGVAASESTGPGITSVSTRIFNGITIVQALMLLGWNALTTSSMRRATCYVGLAGRIVAELKEQICTTADPKASSRINGIDVFDVERELIDHLYWTTYAICLWAFVQTGDQKFAPALPATQPSILVPVTEATSSVIQLDIVSENFSTLHTQKAAIRETWPLAHVASVVAYICTFYPPDSDVALWQSGMPVAQQRLHNGQPPSMNVGVVCHEITRVLTESINHFHNQTGDLASRSLVLAAYHTLAVQFLFPAQSQETFAADVVDRFYASTQEILQCFTTVCDQPQPPFASSPSLRAQLPGIFSLAIDTCSRAFAFIHSRGTLLLNNSNTSTLESLSSRLYLASKAEFLSQGSVLRMARKQLKGFIYALGNGASRTDHCLPPAMSRDPSYHRRIPGTPLTAESTAPASSSPLRSASRSLSPLDSDHLSTASTAPVEQAPTVFHTRHEVPEPTAADMARKPSVQISTTSLGPVSPGDVFKPSWQMSAPDDLFRSGGGTLNPTALGVDVPAPSGDHLCGVSGGDAVDLQSAWFPEMAPHTIMELDMAAAAAAAGGMGHVQWEWPELHGDGMTTAPGPWEIDAAM